MSEPKADRIYVPISDEDRAKLKRRAAALENSEAGLARLLLQYGLRNAGLAVKEALDAIDDEEPADGTGTKQKRA